MDYIRRIKPKKPTPYVLEAIVLNFQRLGFQFISGENVTSSSRAMNVFSFISNRLAGIEHLKIISHEDEIEIRARYRNPLLLTLGVLFLLSTFFYSSLLPSLESIQSHPWTLFFLIPTAAVLVAFNLWPKSLWHPWVSKKLDQMFANISADRYPYQ